MTESGRDFVLVAEDSAAAIATATIVDRVVHERGAQWQRDLWDEELRSQQRRWRALRTDAQRLVLDGLGTFSKKQNVAPSRKITTLAPRRGGAAVEVAKFFAALDEANEQATLAAFACDLDGQSAEDALREHEERAKRAKKNNSARAECFLLALAQPEFEAWFIVGFEPRTDEERFRLEEQQHICGFDPREHPERLQSTSGGPRDAKKVLAALCASNKAADERVRACVERCSLDALENRCSDEQIRRFIQDVTQALLPTL